MQKNIRDNLAKFFYDGGRIALAVLVFGAIAKNPIIWKEVVSGATSTLILLVIGVIFDLIPARKEQ